MNNKAFKIHSAAVSALFILGNCIMLYPLNGADGYTFFALLVSLGILMGGFWAVAFIWGYFTENLFKCKWSAVPVLSAVAVFAAFIAADSFKAMIKFVKEIILPSTPMFFIALLFAATVVYFALKRQENVLKFALCFSVLVFGVIIFFFAAATENFNFRNIFIFKLPPLKVGLTQLKPYFINPVTHSFVLPVYLQFALGNYSKKTAFCGVAAGGILLGLGVLCPVLLFGAQIAGELAFPFSSAASTVSVGRLFTRLDGFAYFVYFICSLVKITVCIFVAFKALQKIKRSL